MNWRFGADPVVFAKMPPPVTSAVVIIRSSQYGKRVGPEKPAAGRAVFVNAVAAAALTDNAPFVLALTEVTAVPNTVELNPAGSGTVTEASSA